MGVASESVAVEKDAPSRARPSSTNDLSVAHISNGPTHSRIVTAAAESPQAAAHFLSQNGPDPAILQRAQRSYGNRASQQIVMRARAIQRKCDCGGTCAKCQEEKEQRVLQRSAAGQAIPTFNGIPSSQGEPLSEETRHPLEAHFQSDLSDVRVHTNTEAVESAIALDAHAYTAGRDIYFAPGMYAPTSASGQSLLAHEVAHVVQQSSGKEPTVATKSAHGVKIGAPDDLLEAEADHAAEDFLTGMQPANLSEEERKKKVPASTVQRFIQRQEELSPGAPTKPGPANPTTPGQTVSIKYYEWTFTDDLEALKAELRKITEKSGIGAPRRVLAFFLMYRNPSLNCQPFERNEACETFVKAKYKIYAVLEKAVPAIEEENRQILSAFEVQAKQKLELILNENDRETRAEMARYGITAELKVSDSWNPFSPPITINYTMQTESVPSLGLADAAKILLERRNNINDMINKREREHVHCRSAGKAYFCSRDEGYATATAEIDKLEAEFARVRRPLEAKYPVLAPFADKKDDPEGLAILANKDPAGRSEKAKLVGEQLLRTLGDIQKVHDALVHNELNIWRLEKLIGLTKVTLGMKEKPRETKLVDEKFEEEKPSPLTQILLLAVNILGLVLAAPTGGLSLAITAGINVAVVIADVREYLLDSALAGSGLGAAKALSEQEPSLFWLAVEIVGAVVDVGTAAAAVTKTFSKLAPLAKAAEEASKGSEEAADAMEALKDAARSEPKGEALVQGIERHFQGASKESEVLEAFGGTKKEAELFESSSKAAQEATEAVVPSAPTIAGGQVKATKIGLFSCGSPCTALREKFAEALSQRGDLNKQLLELEAELVAKQGDEAALKSLAKRAAKIEDELLSFEQELARARLSPAERKILEIGEQAAISREQAQEFPRIIEKLKANARAGRRTLNLEALTDHEREILEQIFHNQDVENLTLADLQAARGRPGAEATRLYEAQEAAIRELRDANRPLYDRVRAASPTERVREQVLKRARGLDEVSGAVPPSGALDVDHIIPLRDITEMPGFRNLPWEDQVDIANMLENLKAVDRTANRSRQALSWAEWPGRTQYTPEALTQIGKQEQAAKAAIQAEIAKRAAAAHVGVP